MYVLSRFIRYSGHWWITGVQILPRTNKKFFSSLFLRNHVSILDLFTHWCVGLSSVFKEFNDFHVFLNTGHKIEWHINMDLHVYISMEASPTGIWVLFLHSFIYWGNIGLKVCISFVWILYFDFCYSVLTTKVQFPCTTQLSLFTHSVCPQCSLWQLLCSLYLSVC